MPSARNLVFICICLVGGLPFQEGSTENEFEKLVIAMPKVQTNKTDSYICLSTSVSEMDKDIVGYYISAIQGRVHHVAWAVCEDLNSNEILWECRAQQGHICKGRTVSFGGWDGWAKSHGVHMLGEDVGVRIGKAKRLNKIILQVHFKDLAPRIEEQSTNSANLTLYMSSIRRPYTMQRYLTSNYGYIPANTSYFSCETACVWEKISVVAVRHSVHTHHHGKLVEAYLIRNGTSKLIARELPQGKHHELFPIIGGPTRIEPGDIIASRCIYENSGSQPVKFGSIELDEMCNFDIEFKYTSEQALVYPHSVRCTNDAQVSRWKDVFPQKMTTRS